MPNPKTFNKIRKLTAIAEFTPEIMAPLVELEQQQYEQIQARLLDRTLANPIPFPDALPYGFRAVGAQVSLSKAYLGTKAKSSGLLVMASLLVLEDKVWYHVSCSRQDALPSYADLKLVRQYWFGDRWAIQVFPPAPEHVNVADFCLHLWHCLDEFPLPKFSTGGHI